MVRQINFGTSEVSWVVKNNIPRVMQYMAVDLLYLFVISLDIMIIFNINYLLEVNTVTQLENPFFVSFYRTLALVEQYSYLLYFSLAALIMLYFYVNIGYIKTFIDNYKKEISLMIKIKGQEKTSKIPIIYLACLINLISCILAWFLGKLFYSGLRRFMVNLTVLDFYYFRITLFVLLIIISVGTGVLATYYLFWRRFKY